MVAAECCLSKRTLSDFRDLCPCAVQREATARRLLADNQSPAVVQLPEHRGFMANEDRSLYWEYPYSTIEPLWCPCSTTYGSHLLPWPAMSRKLDFLRFYSLEAVPSVLGPHPWEKCALKLRVWLTNTWRR